MTDVHILKGPHKEWFARPREVPDVMLCGATANYYNLDERYWDISTCLSSANHGDWRDAADPTCAACLLLHTADPTQTLVIT